MHRPSTRRPSPSRARPPFQPGTAAALAAILLVGAVGCSDASTSIPEDQAPVLGNFTFEVLDPYLDEPCPTTESGQPSPSALIRWSVDYSDVNGDVTPPFFMLWRSRFAPGELPAQTALLTVSADAVSAGDASEGTVSLRQCVKYVGYERVETWVWILDAAGNWSDFAFLEIPRPEGAPAPPPARTGEPGVAREGGEATGHGGRVEETGVGSAVGGSGGTEAPQMSRPVLVRGDR